MRVSQCTMKVPVPTESKISKYVKFVVCVKTTLTVILSYSNQYMYRYLTTRHVETFVVGHLQHQIDTIEQRPRTREQFANLRAMLEQIRDDEAHHKDEGSRLAKVDSDDNLSPWQRAWADVIKAGSAGAVSVARWV